MCEEVLEKTEFTIDELEGSARYRALDRLATMEAEDMYWANSEREDLVKNTLPTDWCITNVDATQMWFDLDGHYRTLALTGGRLDLQELVTKKPELFAHLNLATLTALQNSMFYIAYADVQREYTRGAEELSLSVCLQNTAFAEADVNEFEALVEVAAVHEIADQHFKEAAEACLQALQEQYDYITSEEHLVELARANEWKFDEEGRML